MIGQSIGNYKILEHFGGTETFVVYKAVDLLLNRNVYIKVPVYEVLNQTNIVEKFRFEAATLAKLVHPNVPTLHSLTAADERLFMITEFLEGESLDKLLRRQGKLSCEKSVSIFTQVLDCLDFAHSAGIAHCDLKAENIFLTETGSIKVLGFGTSDSSDGDLSNKNNFSETTSKPIFDAGKDIYAVGNIFFEALTGEKPPVADVAQAERLLRGVELNVTEKVADLVINIFRLQMYGKFQSASEILQKLLPSDFGHPELQTVSDAFVSAEFLGRAGSKSAAECSIDFSKNSNDSLLNASRQSRSTVRNAHKVADETTFNWKLAQKNVLVGISGILAIFALHFFFQFSFINNDAVQIVKDLNKSKDTAEIEPFPKMGELEKVETIDEIDPFVKQNDEKQLESVINSGSEAQNRTRKPTFTKKPEIVSPPVQIRSKTVVPRNILRRKESSETTAERLRRAEKILTGA